jgi:FkbM family methyltransferase
MGWTGVCLEPQKDVCQRLRKNYEGCSRVSVLRLAIDEYDGTRPLYRIKHPDPEKNDLLDKLSSFHKDILIRNATLELGKTNSDLNRAMLENLELWITTELVDCMRVDTLLDRLGWVPDLLDIDAEGHESTILLSFDINRYRIPYIFYENYHLSPLDKRRCQSKLISGGYKLTFYPEYQISDFNIFASLTGHL